MRIGSLFSGYGGLDLAVASVFGASLAWHVEFDKHPSAILDAHFPDVPNYGDVTTVDWSTVESVDILTGGFPCQDLSHAGKRAGLRPGTRSGLWNHMAYAINELRPRLVVIENVRGLLSAGAHSDVEPCAWCLGDEPTGVLRALGSVLGDLADLGYDARWGGVRAADAGAPHGRFRVFIVAYPADSGGRQLAGTAAAGHGLPVPAERGDGPVALFSTPTSSDRFGAGRPPGRDGGDDLRTQISLLPTPKATNNDNQQNLDRYGLNLGMALLPDQYDWTNAPHLLPTPTPFTNSNNESPEDWLERRADVIERTGTHHGLPLAVAAASISEGKPILQSDPMGSLLPTPQARDHKDAATFGSPARWGDVDSVPRAIGQLPPSEVQDFGPYSAAVARWEAILGRPAPAPTEPGSNGKPRLSPRFVEWMMGLPDGWVTDAGIPRNAQLKALGNGVVPQQAALALRLLGQVVA